MDATPPDPVDPIEAWAPLVGRLLLACGHIELLLLQLAGNLGLRRTDDDSLLRLGLKGKAVWILKAAGRRGPDEPPPLGVIRHLLNRVIILATTRDVIAHSPLSLELDWQPQAEAVFVPRMRSLKNMEHHLTHEDIKVAAAEADTIRHELSSLVIEVGWHEDFDGVL